MLQTEKRNLFTIVLYCLAFLMLIYTLYWVYVKFMMPFAASEGPNYEGLELARMYQLIANLLFICSFLLPGIYGAWKNKKFRVLFPGLEIFQLMSINFIWLR
jgi:hypothetical protein